MTTLRRLTDALAACSVLTTTVALPASDTTAIDSSLAPVPAACTVQENSDYDNYSITVPVKFSAVKCSQAKKAHSSFTTGHESDWLCQPYGNWIMVIFTANKNVAGGVNKAMKKTFPRFNFPCANSQRVEADSGLRRKGFPDVPAACTLEQHDTYDLYEIFFPLGFSGAQRQEAKTLLSPYINDSTWEYLVFGASGAVDFQAPKNSADRIDREMTTLLPAWNHRCADQSATKAASDLERKDTLVAAPAVCKVLKKGDFAKFVIRFPGGLPDAKCKKLQMSLVEYIDAPSFMWNEVRKSTVVKFNADENNVQIIDKQLSAIYGSWDQKCAAPTAPTLVKKNDHDPIAPHTQSCLAEDHGAYATWRIHIGEPFDEDKCYTFHHILMDTELVMNTFGCRDDGYGDTFAYLDNIIKHEQHINDAAHTVWPEVNGFNCPSH